MDLTIFAGTFNPIHISHLIIAETVRDALNTDKFIIVPSYLPPHRNKDILCPKHRFNMVKLAIKDNPFMEISDIEHQRGGKSYSVNTVKEILDLYNPDSLNFIIGADAFHLIDTWYKVEELAGLVKFIIITRPDSETIEDIINSVRLKNFKYQEVKTPLMDISSTLIRNKIKEGESIKYLVRPEVENYIIENGLYK